MGILSRHKKEIKKAGDFYKTLGKVQCPYLDGLVKFNSNGFHHLKYNPSGSERGKSAQMHKFSLLPSVKEIIKNSGTLQEYRKQWGVVGRTKKSDGSREMKEMEFFGFVGIVGTGEQIRVRVIVRKIGSGDCHFWSVMSDTDLKRKTSYKLAHDDIADG